MWSDITFMYLVKTPLNLSFKHILTHSTNVVLYAYPTKEWLKIYNLA